MATRGTITIDNNQTNNTSGYDTFFYPCWSILNNIYTGEFSEFLLQVEFTVGGTYNFNSNANGQTCYMYYGNGPMKTFGVVNNGRLNVATTTFNYVAGDVQAHPEWFSRISFGCGTTSDRIASIKPASGNGKFHIVMHFNIPDWFVAGERIAQTNDGNHQRIHRFIQFFYGGTMYVPFRISTSSVAAPFTQQIRNNHSIAYPIIGTSDTTMSATVENTLLYSTYANRTFTYN